MAEGVNGGNGERRRDVYEAQVRDLDKSLGKLETAHADFKQEVEKHYATKEYLQRTGIAAVGTAVGVALIISKFL